MPWDYKRDFEFLANVVKMHHTFYFLVGRTLYNEPFSESVGFLLSFVGSSFKAR